MFVRPNQSDLVVLHQIFRREDCGVELQGPVECVIDAGANVGYSAVYFAEKYPNATIVAVEPERENGVWFKANTSAYPNIRLVEGGVWWRDADLTISNPDALSYAFQVVEQSESCDKSFPGYSIETLLKRSGRTRIDLLKMDIEGAEEVIFSNSRLDWLESARAIVIEIHSKEAMNVILDKIPEKRFSRVLKGDKWIFIASGEDGAN